MRLAARSAHVFALSVVLAAVAPGTLAPHIAEGAPPLPERSSPPAPLGGTASRSTARLGPADEARGRASACGTRLESAVEMLLEHDARTEGAPLPTPN